MGSVSWHLCVALWHHIQPPTVESPPLAGCAGVQAWFCSLMVWLSPEVELYSWGFGFRFLVFVCLFLGCTWGMWKFPGQGVESTLQQWLELLQWQRQILTLMYYKETPWKIFKIFFIIVHLQCHERYFKRNIFHFGGLAYHFYLVLGKCFIETYHTWKFPLWLSGNQPS